MIIVVDVNIILSALIRNSTTREIIVKHSHEFFFPEPSLHKLRKYKALVCEKAGLSEHEFSALLHAMFCFITIIPTEEILSCWNEAKKIMEHIDPEDVPFIAAALSLDSAVIWSDDKHFDKQERVPHFKTKDIVALLRS